MSVQMTSTELRDLMETWPETHPSFMDAVQDALATKAMFDGVARGGEEGDGIEVAIIFRDAGVNGCNYTTGQSVVVDSHYVSWLRPHSVEHPGLVREYKLRERVLAITEPLVAMTVLRGFIREGVQ